MVFFSLCVIIRYADVTDYHEYRDGYAPSAITMLSYELNYLVGLNFLITYSVSHFNLLSKG